MNLYVGRNEVEVLSASIRSILEGEFDGDPPKERTPVVPFHTKPKTKKLDIHSLKQDPHPAEGFAAAENVKHPHEELRLKSLTPEAYALVSKSEQSKLGHVPVPSGGRAPKIAVPKNRNIGEDERNRFLDAQPANIRHYDNWSDFKQQHAHWGQEDHVNGWKRHRLMRENVGENTHDAAYRDSHPARAYHDEMGTVHSHMSRMKELHRLHEGHKKEVAALDAGLHDPAGRDIHHPDHPQHAIFAASGDMADNPNHILRSRRTAQDSADYYAGEIKSTRRRARDSFYEAHPHLKARNEPGTYPSTSRHIPGIRPDRTRTQLAWRAHNEGLSGHPHGVRERRRREVERGRKGSAEHAEPWLRTREEFTSGRTAFDDVGYETRDHRHDPDKPGLHVDKTRSSGLVPRGEEHTIVYRDSSGTPLAHASVHVPHKEDRAAGVRGAVAAWGRDPNSGVKGALGAIRLMKWAHERDSAHPLGTISRHTAANYHQFMVRQRHRTHGDVPEHVLKDYGIKSKTATEGKQLELFPKTEKSWVEPLLVVFV